MRVNEMKIEKNGNRIVFVSLLAFYVLVVFGFTLMIREPSGKDSIQTEWLYGFNTFKNTVIIRDCLLNFLLFIPLGVLVSLVSDKYKIIRSLLFGLFVSETIECSQLIWQLGSFDVNDLLFNTLGTLIGGLIVVLVIEIRKLVKKKTI